MGTVAMLQLRLVVQEKARFPSPLATVRLCTNTRISNVDFDVIPIPDVAYLFHIIGVLLEIRDTLWFIGVVDLRIGYGACSWYLLL